MGQISRLDQLISSSAFNDCSVTVIYLGVIITDVLLLCGGPLSLIVPCRCDRVFWDYSSLFFCGALHFFAVSSCAEKMHVFLGGPTRGHESRRVHILPRTNRRAACLNRKYTYQSCFHVPLSSTLYYQMCIHV